jgi:hypothetical protein
VAQNNTSIKKTLTPHFLWIYIHIGRENSKRLYTFE